MHRKKKRKKIYQNTTQFNEERTICKKSWARILATVRGFGRLLCPLSYAFPMIGTLSIGRDRHSKPTRISVVGQWLLLFFDVPRDRLTRAFFHLLIAIRRRTRNILSVTRPSRCDLTFAFLADAQPCVRFRNGSIREERNGVPRLGI